MHHARAFLKDLSWRIANRIQLSSDALAVYPDTVEDAFGPQIDYGQVVKTYSVTHLSKEAASRYSPAEVKGITAAGRLGQIRTLPDWKRALPPVAMAIFGQHKPNNTDYDDHNPC